MWGVEGGEQEKLAAPSLGSRSMWHWNYADRGDDSRKTALFCEIRGKEDQTKKKLKWKDTQINNSRHVDAPT